MKILSGAAAAGLMLLACVHQREPVRGRAQVVTWSEQPRLMVVALCDSGTRYQLGIHVSNASPFQVDEALSSGTTPVLIELVGYPASLPSSWQPAPDVAGVLSVGHIKVVGRGTCVL